MSVLEFQPIHNFSRVRFHPSSTLKIQRNISTYIITLALGLLGYCETNSTFYRTQERAFAVINILKLLDFSQSTIFREELSFINITNNS